MVRSSRKASTCAPCCGLGRAEAERKGVWCSLQQASQNPPALAGGCMALWPCRFAGGRREWGFMNTTLPVRLYPTPDQAATLRAHCQEYINTVNVLVAALDSDVLAEGASTKDFTAALP